MLFKVTVTDVMEDPDGDGLDSDGDGLNDGEEVNDPNRDPLNPDNS